MFTTASSQSPRHLVIPIQLDSWPHSCCSVLAFIFLSLKRGMWVTVADALPPPASFTAFTYSPAYRSVSHSHLHVPPTLAHASHTTCALPPPSLPLLLYGVLFNAVLVGKIRCYAHLQGSHSCVINSKTNITYKHIIIMINIMHYPI